MIYCTQCGAPCDEHDAFCKACGARLMPVPQPAADTQPAPAGAETPAAPTDTAADEKRNAAPRPAFAPGGAPAPNRAVPQGAAAIAREKGGSALFFAAALAFSVMLVFSLFTIGDSSAAMPLLRTAIEKAGYGTFVPLLTQFTASAALEARAAQAVLTGLSAVGIWLLYAALQDKRREKPSLAGSVVLKIAVFAHIALAAVVFVLVESFFMLIVRETSSDSFYVLAALAALVFVFVLFYFIAPLSLLGSLKRALRKGQARAPGFTVYFNAVNILIAVFSCLTAYVSESAFATLSALAGAAFYIFTVILVAGWRRALQREELRQQG